MGLRPGKLARRLARCVIPRAAINAPIVQRIKYRRHAPILVYQMGKVGSRTVVRSLRRSGIPNHVYHLHTLTEAGEAHLLETLPYDAETAGHLVLSRQLQGPLRDPKRKFHCHVVSLVRDPIARIVSLYFHMIQRTHPECFDEQGEMVQAPPKEEIINQLMAEDPSYHAAERWFENEIQEVFDVDVYATPFDQERGWTIIQGKGVSILVFRLEDLTSSFSTAACTFLGRSKPIELLMENTASQKNYASVYKQVLNQVKIPQERCRAIYDSKFARHFYSESQRERFIERWSAPASSSG